MAHPLKIFEWHDLPLVSLTFATESIRVVVTPFCEDKQEYEWYELLLTDASKLTVAIEGEMDFKSLKNLEVAGFDFTVHDDRLTGELGILPAGGGFWRIAFTEAAWRMTKMAEQAGVSDGDKPPC